MRALYTIVTPRHVEDVAAPELVVLGRRPLLVNVGELVEPETKMWGAEVGSHGDWGEKTRSHSPKPVDDLTRCGAGI
jgi:hypothetical protein